MRILLIDDDVELCALLAELLKREGFDVQMEHDGVKGLERARALGLAIARRAVELHKGTICARNMDPGLLVEIRLPTETS